MKLYRGQGVTRSIDSRSTIGRYWTNDLATAEVFADAMGGRVFVVDVASCDLPPAIRIGRDAFEYLVSRAIADTKRLLEATS